MKAKYNFSVAIEITGNTETLYPRLGFFKLRAMMCRNGSSSNEFMRLRPDRYLIVSN